MGTSRPFARWRAPALCAAAILAAGALAPTTATALLGQTITFATLGSQTYGAAPFTVSATASSGLSVSFAATTAAVCTVSASMVTILAAGTCTIQASQAGDATYAAAPSVSRSFTVAKAGQTITFAALSGKTYGNTPFTVSATASSGLAVTFVSATTAVCTVSGTTVTIVAGGTCTIQARQAGNGNYLAATSVNQSFAVAKASQTITFGALANKTYGNPPFSVSAIASSGLAVTFTSGTTAVCTVSGSTVTIVTGGTCSIKASQSGNASYLAATTVTQSFTIAKASQTITFGALANQTYGVAPFAVSASASSGLTVAFSSLTTTVCTVSASTVTLKAGGTCTIQAAQAGNTSYNAATSVSRSFTVAKASQTISFVAPANQTFGAAPFAVSATASSGLTVTFSSLTTTVCTVSGSTVTIKAAGTCTLQAAQAGNTGYNAATSVSQSFTVAKADQTITFGALSDKTFGSPPFGASASASSGLAVTFSSLTAGACTVSGTTVTLVAAGTCTIQAAQAGNGNYNAAQNVIRSFTVGGATQTINFPPPGNQLLTASPVYLAATASSGLAVTLTSQTSAVCTVSGSYATLLSSGTCTVQATQAGNGTYTAAPSVTRSFVVMEVPQFNAPQTHTVGYYPRGIAGGDFNGDGVTDFAVANAFDADVSVLLGKGDGTFTNAAAIPSGGTPEGIAAGDFNGDGKLDLAIANTSGNAIGIYAGGGNGTFAFVRTISVSAPLGISTADLNADGKLDLVIVDGSYGGTTGQTVSVSLGNGDGSFHPAVVYSTGSSPYAAVIGDFNGDGKPDLAVVNGDPNTVSILLGRGDGTFASAVNYATGWYPDAIAVGDFNADGKLDLAIANDYSNDVSILFGHGDGTFAPANSFFAGSGPASIAVADFNQDGQADLAVANRFDKTLVLLLGNGDGSFQAPLPYLAGVGTLQAVLAADFDRDGKLDLIAADATNNMVWLLSQKRSAPTTLAVQSGSLQTAAVGTAYAGPLAVLVEDERGHPLPGLSVTFTAPPAGPSGTFQGWGTVVTATSDVAGVATAPPITANATTGSFSVTAKIGALTALFALTNTPGTTQAPALSGAPPPNWPVNVPYDYALAATGIPAPTFAVTSGGLPTGLTLNSATGVIAGTPGVVGTFAGMFTATNGVAPNATLAFSISITGAPQAIAFAAVPNQTFGSQPPFLAATASSGLSVTFAVLTPSVCAINGNTISLIRAGTCTIRASQSGNSSYAAAPDVDRSFTVARATQTINFNAIAAQVALDTPIRLVANATSGLPVSFKSLTPAVCSVNVNSAYLLGAGTCTVRASQDGSANYGAAPDVLQSVVYGPPSQVLTFWQPSDHALGTSPFPLEATASSGLPVSFTSLSTSICTVSGATVTLVAVGTCTIRASQPGNSSYSAVMVERSFQVSAAVPPSVLTGPMIEYTAVLGTDTDTAFDVVVSRDGSAYVGGSVATTDFPGLSSATFTNGGLDLLYVAKLAPDGRKVDFATVVGGRAPDITGTGGLPYVGTFQSGLAPILGGNQVEAMAIDSGDNVYVAAYAHSTTFPLSGGTYARTGPKSIFRITPAGTIQTVTNLLDPAVMTVRALAVDGAGAIYFTGVAGPGLATTQSAAIRAMPPPVPGTGFWTQTAPYLIKLDPSSGSKVFATYLTIPGARPCSALDANQSLVDATTTAYAIAVDAAGNTYLAGQATADQFPVTPGSPDTLDTKNRDAFVAKVDAVGSKLLFVARLGRTDAERATSIALAPDGGIVVGGKTATQPFTAFSDSIQYVVEFQPQTLSLERETGFVAKLSADGTRWLALAAIGTSGGNLVAGSSPDTSPYPLKVAVDAAGSIYAAGTTSQDRSLPLPSRLPGAPANGPFIIKMSADATRLTYSTTFGDGVVTGLALDPFGNAFVTGYDTLSFSPLPDALFPNVFVAKLNDQAAPLLLSVDQNPATAGNAVALKAVQSDSRYAGSVQFAEGTQTLGTAPLSSGVATLSTTLAAGIHRLRAVFHGEGPFDGSVSPEIILVVNQAAAP